MKGSELKYLIKIQGLTQQDAAEILGISRQTLNTWCKLEQISESDALLVSTKIGQNVKIKDKLKFLVAEESHAPNIGEGVPVYDVDVTAGNSLDFSNHPPEMIKGYISLPNFKNCIAFIMVRGDSMYPKFKAGDLIGLEPVTDMSIIQWGHAYVVVTQDNQRMLKYLRKGENKETIILRSESELYDDIDLPMKKVLKLYMAKGPVRDDWQ